MAKRNNKWKAHEKIAELQEKGYRVEVEHERWNMLEAIKEKAFREDSKLNLSQKHRDMLEAQISPVGGATYIEIWRDFHEEKTLIAVGQAECSVYDNFNKKLGIQIALGR